MNSLFYLMLTTFKNQLKEILKSPLKLTLYVLGIGFMVLMLVTSVFAEFPEEPTNPLFLKGIFFGFFMLTLGGGIFAGLKGASPYSMEDVNLLFPSPIRPKSILLFGIIKAVKPIILGSWFIIFQAGWFRSSFGVGLVGFMFIWLGYVLFAFISQLLQIFVYAFTHASEAKKRVAAVLITLCFVPLFLSGAIHFINADFVFMDGLIAILGSRILDLTPFIGWAASGTANLALGNTASAALSMGLTLAFGGVLFVALYIKDPDFYEHAAGATQSVFEAQRDMMGGDLQSTMARENVKVKGVGLFGFTGAAAFFGKHLRESLRAGRFGLWGLPSLTLAVAAVMAAYFFMNENASDHGGNLLIPVLILMGVKYFSAGMGRGYLETFSHYIYLIPENPMKKWLWANGENIAKAAGEGAVIFLVAGIITREHPIAAILMAVLYVSFTFYMLAINLAFMRFAGILYRSPYLAAIFVFVYIVPALPGVTLAVLAVFLTTPPWSFMFASAVLVWWLLVCGFMLFMASKSVLHNCDIPQVMMNLFDQSKL